MQLSYSGSFTFEKLIDKSPSMSASDYITWRRWAYYNADPVNNPRGDQPSQVKDQDYFSGDDYALTNVNKGWASGTWDGSKVTNTDWGDLVTQTGITQEHTVRGQGHSRRQRHPHVPAGRFADTLPPRRDRHFESRGV